MKIVNVEITKIKPYERNPRENDNAVDAVANSIKEFGWQQPIVVDKQGTIIAGHTRYKAAIKLGIDIVPVVYAENLTEEQVRAYRLADNKSGELATWDESLLSKELNAILNMDMTNFGFDDLDSFLDEQEAEDDNFDEELPEEPKSKLGQIYQLGRHRLMCGDIVLDLFGGSGTTIMACEQNGRNAYVMEYDPRYVDVIIDRWEKYTGQKAKLVAEEN